MFNDTRTDEGTRPSSQPEKNPAPRGEEDGRMMSAERDSEIYFYMVSSSGLSTTSLCLGLLWQID